MKKSSLYSSKKIARKDFLNSFTAISALLIIGYGIMMYLYVLNPEKDPYGKTTYLIQKWWLSVSEPECYIFCCDMSDAILLTVIGGLALGIAQFEFLHRKKYCSTLLSFAVNRKQLFLNRLIIPFVMMVLCITVPHLIALKFNIDVFGFSGNMLMWFILHLSLFIQVLSVCYMLAVTACMYTGRTIEALAGAISFAIIPVSVISLIEKICNLLLYGYSYTFNSQYIYQLTKFDPTKISHIFDSYAPSAKYLFNSDFDKEDIFRIIFSFAWIFISFTILFLVTRNFSKKFKPENSGFKGNSKGMVFLISFAIPLLISGITIDAMESYFYPIISRDTALIAIITAMLIGFIASILCGLIIHFTHKKLKISLLGGGVVTGITVAIVFMSLTGFCGIFNKVPDAEKIEKIVVEAPFAGFFPNLYGNEEFSRQTLYSSSTALVITDKEDIETVIELHEKAAQKNDDTTVAAFNLTYTMKDGSSFSRSYRYLGADATGEIIKLWDTKAAKEMYKKCLLSKYNPEKPDYFYSKAYYETAYVSDYNESDAILDITSKDGATHAAIKEISEKDYDVLKKAIYSDICSLNSSEWFTPQETQIGKISFSYTSALTIPEGSESFDVYINKNMTNTIKALQKIGLSKYLKNGKTVDRVLTGDIKEVISWINPRLSLIKQDTSIHIPYFVQNEFAAYYFTDEETTGQTIMPPVKEITNRSETNDLIEKGYMAYNIGNNGRFVFVKYTDNTYSTFVIPYND